MPAVQSKKAQQPSPMIAFAQISKVDEEKRLVFGRAVQQLPDHAKEEFDYAGSKPFFQEWSKSQLDASMGKSAGNIRGMHSKVAAGIIPNGGLAFNDEEAAIDICAHVVDDQEWKKVLTATYTGFSIGGSYVSRSAPDENGVVKYVAKPSEISLVDRPCVPTATFFDVIKADGSTSRVQFEAAKLEAAAIEKLLEDSAAAFKSGGAAAAEKVVAGNDTRWGRMWDSLGGSHDACATKMKGKVDDPHAYCNWLAGKAGARGKAAGADMQKVALVRSDGKALGIELEAKDLPKEGEEFDAGGARYFLQKLEDGKATVDEVVDVKGTPAELGAFAKALSERGLSIAAVTELVAKQFKPLPPETDVLARAAQMAMDEAKLDLKKADEPTRKLWTDKARAALAKDFGSESTHRTQEGEASLAAHKASATAQDKDGHRKAADAHEKAADMHAEAGNHERAAMHQVVADYHTDAARHQGKDKSESEKAERAGKLKKALADLEKIAEREDTNPKEGKQKYGNVKFADEKNKKYPIDTEPHIRAAWSYINMPKNSGKYSAEDLKSIKAKIKAAAKEKGIEISDDEEKAAPAAFEKAVLARASSIAKKAKGSDAALSAEGVAAKASRAVLRKGLATCGSLAYLLDSLCQIAESMELETLREGDDSGLADDLYVHIAGIGEVLRDMVAEEVQEEVEGDDEDEAAHGHMGAMLAAAEGVVARVDSIRKATHVAVSQKRVQKMHDMAVGMGAKCTKGEPATTVGDANTVAQARQLAAAVSDEMRKAAPGGDPEALAKVVAAAIEKAVAPLNEKIKRLEEQPAPMAGIRIRAISKEEDGGSGALSEAQRLIDEATVRKSDGTVDPFATAMRMVIKQGGQNVDPTKDLPGRKAGA